MTRHVVITGASGFVGRALVARLRLDGHVVSVLGRDLDRLRARFGADPEIVCAAYGPGASGRPDIAAAMSALGPRADAVDAVVHLAGAAHDPAIPDADRGQAIERLTDAMSPVIARHPGLTVNLSSIAAREDQRTGNSRLAAYGGAKAASERALAQAAEGAGGFCLSLRPPAIWGPGAPGSFATVRALIAKGLPLPIGGSGVPRAYLHIDRLVESIARVIAHPPPSPGHATLEIADSAPYRLDAIFRAVAAGDGRPIRILPVPGAVLRLGLTALGKRTLVDQAFSPLSVDNAGIDGFLRARDGEGLRP